MTDIQARNRRRHGKGGVRIGADSGLRKLMRAARRGTIPSERMFKIEQAMQRAAARAR